MTRSLKKRNYGKQNDFKRSKIKRNYNKPRVFKEKNKKSYNKGIRCYKCGKTGHYKKNYPLIRKIRALEISEEEKQEWLNLLGSSESENSSMDEESLSEDCENGCLGICDCNEINVITGKEKLFKLITKIDDEE